MTSQSVGRVFSIVALGAALSVSTVFASGANLIIHGPSSLYPGETGTYSVEAHKALRVVVSDGEWSETHAAVAATGNYQFRYTMPVTAAIASTHSIAAGSATIEVTAVRPPPPTETDVLAIGSASINLTWYGTSPEYRVLRKDGASQTFRDANDPGATLVYEGPNTTAPSIDLSSSTTYTFAVFGKVRGAAIYSSSYQKLHATTNSGGSIGNVYFVNAGTGNDMNSGTSGSPWKTIKKAMTVALSSDVITVAPGTYNLANGETFPITLTSGVQLLGAGAATTIIDSTSANQRVLVCNGNNSDSKISGFTITGGLATANIPDVALGGGIYCINVDQTTITRNVITGNTARGYIGNTMGTPTGGDAQGGGIYTEISLTRIVNNIISHNTAVGGKGTDQSGLQGGTGGMGKGGGVYLGAGATQLINNTIVSNIAKGGDGGASTDLKGGDGGDGHEAGGWGDTGTTSTNNIYWSNTALGGNRGTGGLGQPLASNGSGFVGAWNGVFANYCVFNNNTPAGGTQGSFPRTGDPLFVNSGAEDYHLINGSSAYLNGTSTGAPPIDFDGYPRPNPPSIGVYETGAATLNIPSDLRANANSTTSVALTWGIVTGATGYEIFSATSVAGGFSSAATTTSPAFTFTNLNPDTTYLYEVRALNGGAPSNFSNVDPATTVIFTDDPLVPGTTTVKAAHITQLRTAVNAMRAAANLGGYTYTDSGLSAGAIIMKVHITDLRTALNEAYTGLVSFGLTAPSFTDPTITIQSTPIKAVHIEQLRAGVE